MLKAKISQVKSNLYAVKTTKYDTTDIELTVETTDSSPWLNPSFELLGIKPDGHEVHQTENFKVVDLNNHIVQVTLDEQFVTCEGNVDLQLLIKDDSRKSSTPFKLFVGRSLDSDILESHRNVKVLNELEKYIIEGREYISEATKLAQSTANYVQSVNTQAEANEAQRLQNESQRQSAETKRKEAEDERKQAEVLRVQNEDTRQSAEVTRIANEQTRLENESNRIERETARENKESIRQTQEQQRHNAESIRQSQEATRQSNEDNRKQAEKSRSQEETIRINSEATRKQAEDARQSQELDRQSAESTRQTAETNRNNAESTRTQNENTRKSQETTRQQKETERQSSETTRQQKEVERQSEETKRLEAEELRKEAYIEARQLLDELQDFEPITEKDRTDYMGNLHQTLKEKNDADVDWLLGEINTAHYEGQHITATETIEGHAKSAILKGNTILVNEENNEEKIEYEPFTLERGYFNLQTTNGVLTEITDDNFANSTTSWYTPVFNRCSAVMTFQSDAWNGFRIVYYDNEKKPIYVLRKNDNPSNVLTLSTPLNAIYFRISTYTDKTIRCVSNKDYLKLHSVKMPVLKTTGKNLFDKTKIIFNKLIDWNTGIISEQSTTNTTDFIKVIPNTQYTMSFNFETSAWTRCVGFTEPEHDKYATDVNGKGDKCYFDSNSKTITFTTSPTTKYLIFSFGKGVEESFQLEQGSTATSYEPYQSNILTVNEPIELRGIGDVKDELNLLTGEAVERIGEIVLNGNERWWFANSSDNPENPGTWTHSENTWLLGVDFTTISSNTRPVKNTISDKYPVYYICDFSDSEYFNILSDNNALLFRVRKDRFSDKSIVNFKSWLSQNPITIQYQLTTESVKTVDLSDNHVYSYKDVTHYDCSSAEGSLVPALSIDVPTNLPALVSRQRETISAQEDQIKLLEETNSELIISQETQDEEIVTNMLASVELFEMVLSMTPLSIDMSKSMEVNPMVEVYVTLILKGEKTIEQVPAIIRDKVQAQLDLLTK